MLDRRSAGVWAVGSVSAGLSAARNTHLVFYLDVQLLAIKLRLLLVSHAAANDAVVRQGWTGAPERVDSYERAPAWPGVADQSIDAKVSHVYWMLTLGREMWGVGGARMRCWTQTVLEELVTTAIACDSCIPCRLSMQRGSRPRLKIRRPERLKHKGQTTGGM